MDNSTLPTNSSSTDGGDADDDSCGGGSPYNGKFGLRVAAIFIILVTSAVGTLFPLVSRRYRGTVIPVSVYDFAKYFGSGVIIATAFIHLLAPANESLSVPCLGGEWTVYPWPEAISMASVFLLFLIEVIAFRLGSERLNRLGVKYHAHGSSEDERSDEPHAHVNANASHPHSIGDGVGRAPSRSTARDQVASPGLDLKAPDDGTVDKDVEDTTGPPRLAVDAGYDHTDDIAAQILAAAILEFGVVFHSVVIGLTLAVDPDFVTLFIVIIFHQMFEGLGLGSRLSLLPLPKHMTWMLYVAAIAYALVTPLGLAIGLGVRTTYDPNTPTANIVSGSLDSFSSGILLYTGLVELLAHDFVFNKKMVQDASWAKLTFSVGCVITGAGIMALLGRWA